jgi:hypothetical protein
MATPFLIRAGGTGRGDAGKAKMTTLSREEITVLRWLKKEHSMKRSADEGATLVPKPPKDDNNPIRVAGRALAPTAADIVREALGGAPPPGGIDAMLERLQGAGYIRRDEGGYWTTDKGNTAVAASGG